MLIRIVKLTFKEENISSFEAIFESTKRKILDFQGCQLIELYQDMENPNVFFTYSHWTNEEALASYRKSDFFRTVWSTTKKLFEDRPMAWSVTQKAALSK